MLGSAAPLGGIHTQDSGGPRPTRQRQDNDMAKLTTPIRHMHEALHAEWIEANGLGDYASSTACGCNARRYHGLLVANLDQIGRHVLLSGVEDWLDADGKSYPLSSRCHPGCVYPEGQKALACFDTRPCPTFIYQLGDFTLVKRILLLPGRHAVLLRYTLKGPAARAVLRVSPLLACRHFHALACANSDASFEIERLSADTVAFQPYAGLPRLYFQADRRPVFCSEGRWIYAAEYPVERERGFPCSEDLLAPGFFEIQLQTGQSAVICASTEPAGSALAALWENETLRRSRELPAAQDLTGYLAWQAGIFHIKDTSGQDALLAGYHWFGSWGRDTLIALPGTTFLAGRLREGLDTLERIGAGMQDGRIPNTFRPDGAPEGYNSIDASLLFASCTARLLESLPNSGSGREKRRELVRAFAPKISRIVKAYRSDRLEHCRLDADGFLEVGTPETQLTWMDAQAKGRPVTPRWGYPVEIEALWYDTLAFARELALELGEVPPCSEEDLARMREVFEARFLKEDGTLCDVWRPAWMGGSDESLRPNQLMALSLPHPVFGPAKAGPVIKAVQERLLTPFGLRTLAPGSPDYCPHYAGGPDERDAAYHQGTVWPWLLGMYADALFRWTCYRIEELGEPSLLLKQTASQFLTGIEPLFTRHLGEAGLGHISEIMSAEEPFEPNGCIAQAWSESEVLRALLLVKKLAPVTYGSWESQLKWEPY